MSAELDAERGRFREVLGRYGLWSRDAGLSADYAAEAERLGFGSLWVGGSPPADLRVVDALLDGTDRLVVGTGIVNIWTADVAEVAASFHRIETAHPGRFILGIGPGHPERVEQAARPYGPLVTYLDELESRGVPRTRLVLAALGPRMTALAGQRTLGAHPYFVPPEHNARAREVLGAGPLLLPEARIMLESDPAHARDALRPGMTYYFELANYRNNLLRLGYRDDALGVEHDAAVDAVAIWGDADRVKARVDEHFTAGADHVLAQLIVPDGGDAVTELRRLAAALRIG